MLSVKNNIKYWQTLGLAFINNPMKKIVWKINNASGKAAYVGSIRIGTYWYNSIDSKNGKYKVTSFMPQSKIEAAYAQNEEEAMQIIITAFETFITEISE